VDLRRVAVQGMQSGFRRGQFKDEPAMAGIHGAKLQHVAEECPIRFRIAAIEKNVSACDHGTTLLPDAEASKYKDRAELFPLDGNPVTWNVRISRRALLIAVAGRLWAQEAKYSTGVDVVTLLATVRDAHGLLAKNLSREDFLLEEDGVPQTIRYFSRESDLPLTVGLLVDTSQSQFHVLEPERRASYTFLDQVLREGQDQAFVAHFDVSRGGTTELYLLAERFRGGTRSTGGPHAFVHVALRRDPGLFGEPGPTPLSIPFSLPNP
jgi:hypothetical protein